MYHGSRHNKLINKKQDQKYFFFFYWGGAFSFFIGRAWSFGKQKKHFFGFIFFQVMSCHYTVHRSHKFVIHHRHKCIKSATSGRTSEVNRKRGPACLTLWGTRWDVVNLVAHEGTALAVDPVVLRPRRRGRLAFGAWRERTLSSLTVYSSPCRSAW